MTRKWFDGEEVQKHSQTVIAQMRKKTEKVSTIRLCKLKLSKSCKIVAFDWYCQSLMQCDENHYCSTEKDQSSLNVQQLTF